MPYPDTKLPATSVRTSIPVVPPANAGPTGLPAIQSPVAQSVAGTHPAANSDAIDFDFTTLDSNLLKNEEWQSFTKKLETLKLEQKNALSKNIMPGENSKLAIDDGDKIIKAWEKISKQNHDYDFWISYVKMLILMESFYKIINQDNTNNRFHNRTIEILINIPKEKRTDIYYDLWVEQNFGYDFDMTTLDIVPNTEKFYQYFVYVRAIEVCKERPNQDQYNLQDQDIFINWQIKKLILWWFITRDLKTIDEIEKTIDTLLASQEKFTHEQLIEQATLTSTILVSQKISTLEQMIEQAMHTSTIIKDFLNLFPEKFEPLQLARCQFKLSSFKYFPTTLEFYDTAKNNLCRTPQKDRTGKYYDLELEINHKIINLKFAVKSQRIGAYEKVLTEVTPCLKRKDHSDNFWITLAKIYCELGDIYLSEKKHTDALKNFDKAILIFEKITNKPLYDFDFLNTYLKCFYNKLEILCKSGKFDRAYQKYTINWMESFNFQNHIKLQELITSYLLKIDAFGPNTTPSIFVDLSAVNKERTALQQAINSSLVTVDSKDDKASPLKPANSGVAGVTATLQSSTSSAAAPPAQQKKSMGPG